MKPLKTFEEYMKEGTVKKQSPDKMRARSLIAESGDSYKILLSFIEKMGLDDDNANHVIKNAYDILMELIRAKMLSDGFNTTGKGAHEAEVSYMAEIGFIDKDVDFANDLRYSLTKRMPRKLWSSLEEGIRCSRKCAGGVKDSS
ncbi:MAG: hypothetical protein WC613_03015 [Candidatus Aenigmatarchaeota archaeon]